MYSLFYGKETYYESFSPYFIWGVVCTVLICFMLFGAIRNLRQAGYELFYILHVLFGVLTIVTVYYHIDLLESESVSGSLFLYTPEASLSSVYDPPFTLLKSYKITSIGYGPSSPSGSSTSSFGLENKSL